MVRKSSKKRLSLEEQERQKQSGGSPAYRLLGQQGLLNQSSLSYNSLPLGLTQNGFSDHIVSTTGGGRRSRSRSARKSRSVRRSRSKSARGSRSRSSRR